MNFYSPLYRIGTMVVTNDSNQKTGKVVKVALEVLIDEKTESVKTTYLVEMEDGNRRKYDEKHLKQYDSKTMDEFLADSLLLSRDSNPKVVDQTIKELLKVEGESNDIRYDSLL